MTLLTWRTRFTRLYPLQTEEELGRIVIRGDMSRNREDFMRSSLRFVSITAVASMLAAVPGSAQKTSGPKERYEMDVATMSGFAAMAT